jgi:hypothetical protein
MARCRVRRYLLLTLPCVGLPGLALAFTAAPPANTYAQELPAASPGEGKGGGGHHLV